MLEHEAIDLVDELRAQLARCPDAMSGSLQSRVDVLRAEAAPDGEWTVVLHWSQGPFGHGLRIRDLAEHLPAGSGTVQDAASEIRLTQIEEPHGARGEQDDSRRYWLGGA